MQQNDLRGVSLCRLLIELLHDANIVAANGPVVPGLDVVRIAGLDDDFSSVVVGYSPQFTASNYPLLRPKPNIRPGPLFGSQVTPIPLTRPGPLLGGQVTDLRLVVTTVGIGCTSSRPGG